MNVERRSRLERTALLVLTVALAIVGAVLIVLLTRLLAPVRDPLPPRHGLEPVLVIDGPGVGEHPRFGRPMGVAFGVEGRLYVTDAEHDRVCVFDARGRFLFEFGGFGVGKPLPGVPATWRPGLMNFPVGIDVDDKGLVYVADFKNDQIQVFSEDGEFIRVFPDRNAPVGRGSSGQDGRGIAVTDVCATGNEVFATDTYQIVIFGADGTFRRQFGRPGIEPGGLDHPNGIAAKDGVIYVSDTNHSRVAAYTYDGNLLWTLGTPVRGVQSTAPAEFSLPRGLTVLDDGTLLVADAFQFALVQVSPDGKVLGRYGDQGSMPGEFRFPNDVDALGDLVAVADKENRRVQVVRLIREDGRRRAREER